MVLGLWRLCCLDGYMSAQKLLYNVDPVSPGNVVDIRKLLLLNKRF